MLFTLEALPAAEGDCLLLHWGTNNDPKLAIIDGGPGRIYETSLLPRLEEILDDRDLDTLPIELVMISHNDSDHIVGVKKLFRQLRHEFDNGQEKTFRVRRLWHNVFNDILGDSVDAYYQNLTANFTASVDGEPTDDLVDELKNAFENRQGHNSTVATENAWDIALVLAGHGEGRDVRVDHDYLFNAGQVAAMNSPFEDGAGNPSLITIEKTPAPKTVAGVRFTIVGPSDAEIAALQNEFDKYLKDHGLTTASLLAAYADESIKNLSSIVCLAQMDNKTILLTGDARGDKILSGLEKAGLVAQGGSLAVDALKVPHHGSDRNVEPEFFERISADCYIFSGNGKHGNPDRATVEWVVESRTNQDRFQLVFTYSIAEIDAERKREAQKRHKPWDPSRDALATLISGYENQGYKFEVTAGAPVAINLGDERID